MINVLVAMRGPQAIGRLAQFSAPTLALAAIALLLWAVRSEHGFGPILAAPATIHGPAFWAIFFPSVIGVIAFWATLALNIPDYSRYAKTQRGQMLGQILSMPLTMAAFSFVGIAVTSATVLLYGKALWNPVELIVTFPTPVVVIAGVLVILSSVTINVGANVMAPARAFRESLAATYRLCDRRGAHWTAEPRDAAVVRALDVCDVYFHVAWHVRRDARVV